MKRVIFEGNGFVPTMPVDEVTAYTRVLLVNGSGDLGIIIYHPVDSQYKNGLFEVTFSENHGKYNYSAVGWRDLLDHVKDKLTIYYV